MSILPEHYNYVRTFYCRQVVRRDEQGRWRYVAEESDLSLHAQVNNWVREDRVQLTVVQSPSMQVLRNEENEREFLLAVTAMYIPPVEGEVDEFGEERPVEIFGPQYDMGTVAEPPEPEGPKSPEGSEPIEDSG